MRLRFLGFCAFLFGTHSAVAMPTPTIVELSTPYPLLQQTVQFGGVRYSAGSVAYGPVGTPIIVRGANFGSSGSITFRGTQGTTKATVPYTSADGADIALTIPSSATTGTLIVTASGQSSNPVPIIVTSVSTGSYGPSCPTAVMAMSPPVVSGLVPSAGAGGTLVTITGKNFGLTQGTVAIGGISAIIVSWNINTILAWVPNDIPVNTLAAVTVNVEGQYSNAASFKVTGPPGPDPNCPLTQ